jgi:hypothetical protein
MKVSGVCWQTELNMKKNSNYFSCSDSRIDNHHFSGVILKKMTLHKSAS